MAEFGYNRDHERWLRQINLAMLTDKDSHMPLAFRIVNGSLGDVQTLKDTVRELSMYGATPYGMVMDRGFWSSEKLQMLTDAGIRYIIPVPNSVGWARKLIARMKNDVFSNPAHTDDDGTATYGCTVSDPTDAGRRIWAHVFYSLRWRRNRSRGSWTGTWHTGRNCRTTNRMRSTRPSMTSISQFPPEDAEESAM